MCWRNEIRGDGHNVPKVVAVSSCGAIDKTYACVNHVYILYACMSPLNEIRLRRHPHRVRRCASPSFTLSLCAAIDCPKKKLSNPSIRQL